MTQPTDEELLAIAREHGLIRKDKDPHQGSMKAFSDFARAVLAKWGAPQQAAQEPVAWTHGPNRFKDWCSQWFGPDSDDDYLAKAVFNLPPMAQVFKEPAPQQAAPAERKQLRIVTYVCPVCAASLERQE